LAKIKRLKRKPKLEKEKW